MGIDHDTAEFAVETIRRWWRNMGRSLYSNATELLITADAGGSNSYRTKAWKYHLQKFADETRMKIVVRHFRKPTKKRTRKERLS